MKPSPFFRFAPWVIALLLFAPHATAQTSWTVGRINLPGVNAAYGVAYGNGRFVATLGGTGGAAAAATSTDGVTWTASALTNPQQGSIVFAAGAFYLAGNNTVLRSTDGSIWSAVYTSNSANTSFRGIATDGRSMMIGSANSNSPTYLYSPDLVTWRSMPALPDTGAAGSTTTVGAPIYAFDRYYVTYSVVEPSQGFRLRTFAASTADGATWNANTTLASALGGYVAAGNGRLFAIGGLTTYLSVDGVNFTTGTLSPDLFNSGPLLFAGGRFFRTGSLTSSIDAITWRPLATFTPNINPPTRAMAYGAGRYVAVGYTMSPSLTDFVAYLAASAPPLITVSPLSRTLVEGESTVFSTAVDNPDTTTTYQWQRDGVAIPGATQTTFTLARSTLGDAGRYSCTVTNALGATSSSSAQVTVVPFSQGGRLFSLSVLTSLDAPDTDFTVGFALDGAGAANPKSLLVRAAGPSLAPFGISTFLPDPRLRIFANGVLAGENNDWGGTAPLTTLATQTGAFGFTSANTTDAALGVANVTTTSNTVVISSATPGRGTGSVIAEIYDATPTPSITPATPRLRALSVLKQIAAGTTLTAGFSISGVTSKTVLIRAVGPGLTQINVPGVLSDPLLTLNRIGTPVAIATNDNWGGSASLRDSFTAAGTFGLDAASRDSALVMTLTPGAYTAVASGVANSSGNVLIEIYELP